MPTFPVPVFAAVVLAALLVRLFWRGEGGGWLRALVALTGLQSLIVSLVRYYDWHELWGVQPVTAVCIPPLAYLACLAGTCRMPLGARDWGHLLPPIFTLFCVLFAPVTLDSVVPAVFLVYGVLILLLARQDEDQLPLLRLESGGLSRRVWALLGISLIASCISDTAIYLDILFQNGRHLGTIVSITSGLLLLLGLIAVERAGDEGTPKQDAGQPDDVESNTQTSTHTSTAREDDAVARELVERASQRLKADHLATDPDLTLSRLARRLGVPAKSLSMAINGVTGGNVSQFVNDVRVATACKCLKNGSSVTEAMLEAGFRTKSNFNREFRRVMATSPTDWLASRGGTVSGRRNTFLG